MIFYYFAVLYEIWQKKVESKYKIGLTRELFPIFRIENEIFTENGQNIGLEKTINILHFLGVTDMMQVPKEQ